MTVFEGTFSHNWREEDTCFLLLPSTSPAHCCRWGKRTQHNSDSRGSSQCSLHALGSRQGQQAGAAASHLATHWPAAALLPSSLTDNTHLDEHAEEKISISTAVSQHPFSLCHFDWLCGGQKFTSGLPCEEGRPNIHLKQIVCLTLMFGD